MGGFGSGRPSGSGGGKVEDCLSINVNRLHKAGCLRPGCAGGWHWRRDGERVASILFCSGASSAVIAEASVGRLVGLRRSSGHERG